MKVPVIDKNYVPCAPCHPARARELVRHGKAVRRFIKGIFYIQLSYSVLSLSTSRICLGLDPGSKRAGITLMSDKETLLNILLNVENMTKDKLEVRANMRRGRRFRKTPCRKNKSNRKRNVEGWVPPSTFSRWNRYLNIIKVLMKIYPISDVSVEDIKAETRKNCTQWNINFSPCQNGKNWFYGDVEKLGVNLHKIQGWETAKLRNKFNFKKTKDKLAESFEAHCVDSWVIANSVFEKQRSRLDNKKMIVMTPFHHIRRQLHRFQPSVGGVRHKHGGTCGLLKKGAMVLHEGVIKYAGWSSDKAVELKDCYGKQVNRAILLKKLTVVVRYNNMGVKYV